MNEFTGQIGHSMAIMVLVINFDCHSQIQNDIQALYHT